MAEIVSMMHVVVDDEVGKLAGLTGALKEAGINIEAVCAWVMKGKGHMLLVTDDTEKAYAAASGEVDSCETTEAVCVKVVDEVGALSAVAGKLSEAGINVNFACATCAGGGQVAILLDTSDNAKAAGVV